MHVYDALQRLFFGQRFTLEFYRIYRRRRLHNTSQRRRQTFSRANYAQVEIR